MPGFTISARETSVLADIVDLTRGPSEEPLGWLVLERLQTLLHADFVTFAILDSTLPRFECVQIIDPSGDLMYASETVTQAQANPFWARYWDPDEGCSYADRSSNYDWVRRSSDVQSVGRARARSAAADGGHDPANFMERMIQGCMPGRSAGHYFRATAWRDGSEFTERDVFYLTLLKPHLERAVWASVTSHQAAPPLTRRQQEVMRMVRAGLTNRQISRRLGVSEGTVHAHLTNVYERLGVQSRTAAVLKLFDSNGTWPGASVSGVV
jgi:DNA-binding CsgD family transcriptional regulator